MIMCLSFCDISSITHVPPIRISISSDLHLSLNCFVLLNVSDYIKKNICYIQFFWKYYILNADLIHVLHTWKLTEEQKLEAFINILRQSLIILFNKPNNADTDEINAVIVKEIKDIENTVETQSKLNKLIEHTYTLLKKWRDKDTVLKTA